MPANRRIQRSVRVTVAIVLLAVAAVVVIGALVSQAALWLGVAAVVAWGAGAAATRILGNELRESRRRHARDRAEQAQAYASLASRRATENAAFASAMKQKVADHAANIDRLKATLRLAEKRATLAEQVAGRNRVALARAQQEIAELRAQIATLETELRQLKDAETADTAETPAGADLAAVEGRDQMPTVVDLLAWNDLAQVEQGQRQHA
ncbi:MAG TPA: hypothetical protein VFJ14_05325 [Nocardioidaceae bacterium]|nr:hypothetical protein [Nocardioidaceae bacterium]